MRPDHLGEASRPSSRERSTSHPGAAECECGRSLLLEALQPVAKLVDEARHRSNLRRAFRLSNHVGRRRSEIDQGSSSTVAADVILASQRRPHG